MEQLIVSPEMHKETNETMHSVYMSARLYLHLIDEASRIHAKGLKSYGIFLAKQHSENYEFRPTNVIFFKSENNKRNDPEHRAAFEAQGSYFRKYSDAGFWVDPQEIYNLQRRLTQTGDVMIAPFHSHRRQPANFGIIDYKLHNPLFPWHLVISMQEPEQPKLQPFRVCKDLSSYGINTDDLVETEDETGGQNPYTGADVTPMNLVIEDSNSEIQKVSSIMQRNYFYNLYLSTAA